MRILFFNYEYPPLGGGAANATEQIFKIFAKYEDVEIDLITSALSDNVSVQSLGDRIRIHRIPIGKNAQNLNYQSQKELLVYAWRALFYARKLNKKRKKEGRGYDLTHSFFALPCGAISLYFRIFHRLPYIVSLRGADVPGYSERFTFIYGLLTPFITFIWRKASFVVTNSKGLTELAQNSAPKMTFHEIYNGIDIDAYIPGKRSLEEKKRDFIILCAARLTYRKGFHHAIDGFAILAEKYPHIRMIIAGGDGGVMRRLQGQAQALNVLDRISFPGFYTKQMARELYLNADVFLLPSLNEGMSNNVLEALAGGLPIVMTSTGGAQELVEDGKNGFIVDFASGEDIAEKVSILIEDVSLAAKMGEASRDRATELSWVTCTKQYYDLYKETVSK